MEKILYKLVTQGGGIDGRDFTDKGGKVLAVSYSKQELLDNKNSSWCNIEFMAIDCEEAKRVAMRKLDVIDKYILGVK